MRDEVRILIVDDVDDAAQALAEWLRLDGFVTRTARDGSSALAAVSEFMPHCVLLDVGMPGMDGLELVRHLRAQYGDEIVLVAVTGGDMQDERVAGTLERVDHYLRKPVDPNELTKILPAFESH